MFPQVYIDQKQPALAATLCLQLANALKVRKVVLLLLFTWVTILSSYALLVYPLCNIVLFIFILSLISYVAYVA